MQGGAAMSRFGRMVRATAVLVLVTGAAVAAWRSLPHLERLAGLTQSDPLDKEIQVRMAAAESASDPFRFRPVQSELTLRLGETGIVFYEARNASDQAQSGQGHFTVTPAAAAPYVVRIACFCSSRQALGPGQTADLPVTFYV
ncbi:cytochrome c oxidase assembly protein, partial [Thioclava sp. BHET1]